MLVGLDRIYETLGRWLATGGRRAIEKNCGAQATRFLAPDQSGLFQRPSEISSVVAVPDVVEGELSRLHQATLECDGVYENLAVGLAGCLGADCWNREQVAHQFWRASTKLPERPVGTAPDFIGVNRRRCRGSHEQLPGCVDRLSSELVGPTSSRLNPDYVEGAPRFVEGWSG